MSHSQISFKPIQSQFSPCWMGLLQKKANEYVQIAMQQALSLMTPRTPSLQGIQQYPFLPLGVSGPPMKTLSGPLASDAGNSLALSHTVCLYSGNSLLHTLISLK